MPKPFLVDGDVLAGEPPRLKHVDRAHGDGVGARGKDARAGRFVAARLSTGIPSPRGVSLSAVPLFDDPLRSELAPRPGSLVGRAVTRWAWVTVAVGPSALMACVILASFVSDRCGTEHALSGLTAAAAVALPVVLVAGALVLDYADLRTAAAGARVLDYGVGLETVEVEAPARHPFRDVHSRPVLTGDRRRAAELLGSFVRRDLLAMGGLVAVLVIVAGIAVRARPRCCGNGLGATYTACSMFRLATFTYRTTRLGADCPTVRDLLMAREVDASISPEMRGGVSTSSPARARRSR